MRGGSSPATMSESAGGTGGSGHVTVTISVVWFGESVIGKAILWCQLVFKSKNLSSRFTVRDVNVEFVPHTSMVALVQGKVEKS